MYAFTLPPTTVTQIVSFILRHRGSSDAFHGADADELYSLVVNAIDDCCIVVDVDSFGGIRGVIVGQLHVGYKRLHIVGLLCNSRGVLYKFAAWLKRQRDKEGFSITATRRGKLVEYDTERLLSKLISRYKE